MIQLNGNITTEDNQYLPIMASPEYMPLNTQIDCRIQQNHNMYYLKQPFFTVPLQVQISMIAHENKIVHKHT